MCGIVGMIGRETVAADLLSGLVAIQHRGQDAAGMATYDGRFHISKRAGIAETLRAHLHGLPGASGVGHVRYPTVGGGGEQDAQPFIHTAPFGIALAHNGNTVNYAQLKEELWVRHRRLLNSECDAELLLSVLAEELSRRTETGFSVDALFEAIGALAERVNGSYSAVALIADHGMVAFRDPRGIKPLVWGRRADGAVAFASESVVLDTLGFSAEGDIAPGEAMFAPAADPTAVVRRRVVPETKQRLCIFEFVYFARPDSVIDGISVYEARLRLGERLGRRCKSLDVDVVVPVPDTARAAALSLANAVGKPYREGLIKNRYIGRTFIMPHEAKRRTSVRLKLNPIRGELAGRHVMLVDDSIVRGNTSRAIVELVRTAGASRVSFAVCSPPLRHPCLYGIDMQTRNEFIARSRTEKDVARLIGADELVYQRLDDLVAAVRGSSSVDFCTACFDGDYPTHVDRETMEMIEAQRRTACQLPLPGT